MGIHGLHWAILSEMDEAEEQSAVSTQISSIVQTIAVATTSTSDKAAETAAASGSLQQLSVDLRRLVNRFRV